jgi:hypothetical protein
VADNEANYFNNKSQFLTFPVASDMKSIYNHINQKVEGQRDLIERKEARLARGLDRMIVNLAIAILSKLIRERTSSWMVLFGFSK